MRRLLLAGAIVAGLSPAVAAHDYTLGDLRIGHPWTRATAAAGAAGGGYMVIRNTGSAPDRLIRAESPAARAVELHTTIRDGEVMRMRPVADITVPPGGEVRLAPGGLHVMFVGTTQRFVQGTRIPARLVFERSGAIDVEFDVEAAGARGGGHQH
jgi:hypothetical protein